MGNRRVPERAEGRRGGPWPRSLARLMAVVALCALAFAVVLPRFGVPPAPRGRLRLAPRAVPIPTALASAPAASIDERIFIHAPDGIDDRMVVAAP